jgi:hypothetical protein
MLGIHQVNSFTVPHEPLQWVAEDTQNRVANMDTSEQTFQTFLVKKKI